MPPSMTQITKGPIIERLEDLMNDATKRQEVLIDLEGQTPLADLAAKYGVAQTQREADHLRNEWFGAWWPEAQAGVGAVDQIVRAGLATALREAISRDVRVDIYWVFRPSERESVDAAVCWSDDQVTLLVQTPKPAPGSQLPHTDPIKMLVWEQGKVNAIDLSRSP